jgi:hypothetical protein
MSVRIKRFLKKRVAIALTATVIMIFMIGSHTGDPTMQVTTRSLYWRTVLENLNS